MDETLGRLQGAWDSFGFSQKIIVSGIVLAVVVSLIVFSIWIREPGYSVLFTELDLTSAGEVTQELEQRGVEYKVTRGGTTVLVAADNVAELRVSLASSGIMPADLPGMELFDEQELGVTDFVQNINLKRALEGELSKTIGGLTVVDKARVHLVFPKESIFKDKGREATASVVVRLKRAQKLSKSQILGITNLVANSVEGLHAGKITIIDQSGNILSSSADDSGAGMINSQIEVKRTIESYLAGKAEEMLETVLGSGKAVVRVNAKLDFRAIETTREVFDPQTVVRSENSSEESNTVDGSRSENSTTNYDINRTVETIGNSGGGIDHLTVAVTVDGHYAEGEGGQRGEYIPLTEDELNELEGIVKGAVGFDETRNDVINIVNLQFHSGDYPATSFETPLVEWLPGLVGKLAVMAILVFLFLLFRKHVGQLFTQSNGFSPFRAGPVVRGGAGSGAMVPPMSNEASLEERTRDISGNDPEQVAKLVQTWMAED